MTDEARYNSPLIDTMTVGVKPVAWVCHGRYFSANKWTAEITFKPKPEPLEVGDGVELLHASSRTIGTIVGIEGPWAWVAWDHKPSPSTVSVDRLKRAEDV